MSTHQTSFLDPGFVAPTQMPTTARARSNDPESSQDAAQHMTDSGEVSRQARECLAFLQRHPGKTTAELGDLHDTYDRYVFARRMADLAKHGLARKGKKRVCKIGRPAQPWWPIPETEFTSLSTKDC